jgi:hypothetical protein
MPGSGFGNWRLSLREARQKLRMRKSEQMAPKLRLKLSK